MRPRAAIVEVTTNDWNALFVVRHVFLDGFVHLFDVVVRVLRVWETDSLMTRERKRTVTYVNETEARNQDAIDVLDVPVDVVQDERGTAAARVGPVLAEAFTRI